MMRGRAAAIIAVLLACFLITGCTGADAAATAPEDAGNVQEEAEEITEPEDKEQPETPEEKKEVPKRKVRRKDLYQEVLYEYREAQEGRYSMEQVEEMGLNTELVQYGWPFAVTGDEVRYLYYDIDADDNDELIITYYNDIADIYAYDGEKVRMVFTNPYRAIAELYPEGRLSMVLSRTASDFTTIWYQFDTGLGDFFPTYELDHTDAEGDSYYTYCYYELSAQSRKEIEDCYRDTGYYPVWVGEWGDELSEEEYNASVPKEDSVKLPEGVPLSLVDLPDDYVRKSPPAVPADASEDVSTEHEDEYVMVDITPEMQKKMNVFLSNFAEQGVSYYDYGHPDMYKVGNFAYMWSYINKNSDVKIEGEYYTVSFDVIKKLADKYLGLTLTKDDLKGIESVGPYGDYFKNGNYYIPAADGESYTGLAIVESAEDVVGGNLRLDFRVYSLDLDIYWDNDQSIPKKYYGMTFKEADASPDLTEVDMGYAIVKQDGDSYKLRLYEMIR